MIDEVVSVILWSGKSFDGPITTWRPLEGYFQMASTLAATHPRVLLKDVFSAKVRDLNNPNKQPECLKQRALNDGWDGKD